MTGEVKSLPVIVGELLERLFKFFFDLFDISVGRLFHLVADAFYVSTFISTLLLALHCFVSVELLELFSGAVRFGGEFVEVVNNDPSVFVFIEVADGAEVFFQRFGYPL